MKIKTSFTFIILVLITLNLKSQSSSEIYSKIQKLNVLGSLLHIGAHPDDENTSLISYFSNKHHIETTYLSITRGDGGQNRIGTELRDALGLIRTHELLAARKIDGANQLFTTANDFGFSKNPNETLNIWDKNELMSQIVKHIRTIRPDIIVNRFDHRTAGTTHGHHTSSALLSYDAFDLSSDNTSFPEHLDNLSIWSPKRLFLNVSWFFYGSQENFSNVDKGQFLNFDYGELNTLTGVTYDEISSKSRSQHKSQGFGRSPSPGGPKWNYLELIKGNPIKSNDPFEGIDISWNRLENGNKVETLIDTLLNNFDFKKPQKNVSSLIQIYQAIENVEDGYWKRKKIEEVKNVISQCLGLEIQLNSKNELGIPNSSEEFNLKFVNPSKSNVQLNSIIINDTKFNIGENLSDNELFEKQIKILIGDKISTPYWLLRDGDIGMYQVDENKLKGLPETPRAVSASVNIEINKTRFSLLVNANYRFNDPVKGEVVTPFTIVPKITVNLDQPDYIFPDDKEKQISVSATTYKDNFKGILRLSIPEGWSVKPEQYILDIKNKNEEKNYSFKVKPNEKNTSGFVIPEVKSEGKIYNKQLVKIDYPHIPKQFIVKTSSSKLLKINLKNNITRVGYIMGAGDKIPESLENININVVKIDPTNISIENLNKFPTVIVGIRAFNVLEELRFKNKILWNYAKNGGTLIIQYNTSRGLKTKDITPFKLEISRDRVTDENSNIKIINKSHSILNYPNSISQFDFNNWVQERGLYFPNNWGNEFEALLEMNDINETKKRGSLLVSDFGDGKIIYTGLSFFRELPAGVPGAYRLFVNLINYGHE